MSSPFQDSSTPAIAILAVITAAIILIKLGALSVWVTVLSLALKVIGVLLIAAGLFLGWQKYRKN